MTALRIALAPAGLVGVVLAGCATGMQAAHDPEGQAPREVVTVDVTAEGFQPSSLTVDRGDVLRFVQRDDAPHNVAFLRMPPGTRMFPEYLPPLVGEGGAERLPPLRVGPHLLTPGEDYELVIDEHFPEGVYEFGCTSPGHGGMRGVLVVRNVRGTAPSR